MDEKQQFGARLKSIRTNAEISVPEISSYLVSLGHKAAEKTIYSWESGKSQPTPDAFLDFCKFCGVVDVMGVFGYKKNSSVDESTLENIQERQVVDLITKLSVDQQEFLLAWLKTTIELKQRNPSSAQG